MASSIAQLKYEESTISFSEELNTQNSGIIETPSKHRIIFCCVLNYVSSISIVLINKEIYSRYKFPNVTLTFIHFIITSIALFISQQLDLFKSKRLPLLEMLPLSLSFCGFVVFSNLSLETNTVGTYQLMKTMTTPCIMFIQTTFYAKCFSTKVKLTVVPIIIGVLLNSCFDIRFSATGIMFASLGVLVTSLYQILVGEKQHKLQVDFIQLLFYQAPLSALLLSVIIPFVEPLPQLLANINALPISGFNYIIGSGLMAFLVNLSIYWIIGNLSPVTYNMVGHLKFCLILLGGFVVFQELPNVLQTLGMLTTFLGVVAYTHFKIQETSVTQETLQSNGASN